MQPRKETLSNIKVKTNSTLRPRPPRAKLLRDERAFREPAETHGYNASGPRSALRASHASVTHFGVASVEQMESTSHQTCSEDFRVEHMSDKTDFRCFWNASECAWDAMPCKKSRLTFILASERMNVCPNALCMGHA